VTSAIRGQPREQPSTEASAAGVLEAIDRLLPLSGLVAVALQVAGFVAMGVAGYRPRGADAVALFTAAPERIEAGTVIGGFYGSAFLLVFVGCVAGSIRNAVGDARLAAIALAGGVTATIALALGYRLLNAGAFQAATAEGLSGELATVLYRLYATSFASFVSMGLAAFLGATGLAILRHPFLPGWLGWTGVASAVVLMTPAHPIGEAFALVWIAAVAVALARQPAG
jgi:hypothetical protein